MYYLVTNTRYLHIKYIKKNIIELKGSSYIWPNGTHRITESDPSKTDYNLSNQNSNIHELSTFMDISLQIIVVCIFLVVHIVPFSRIDE